MRIKRLILFLFLLPVVTFAQTTISGKVTTSVSHTGIGKVSVFLSNSSYGTVSADDGSFQLVNVRPGQYTLVATSLGYKEYTKQVLVGHDPITIDIPMESKVEQLRGVVITSPADFKKNLELFKREFIGIKENAKKCEIINPHTLNMVYHARKLTLEAWTDDFLIVENKALGYRIKFLLDTFSTNGINGITQWEGKVYFEELKGTDEQKNEWKRKREESYYGSSRNFFRSLYNNTLTQDGFVIRRLTRELNPDRPDDAVIHQKLNYFKEQPRTRVNVDSFNYYIGKLNISKYYHESLSKQPLQPFQIFEPTGKPGLYALKFSFTGCLYVVYTKKREDTDFKDIYRTLDMPNYETSVLTLFAPYALFDSNGVVFQDPPLIEGSWSKDKLSELLPFDYIPGEGKGTE
ncbi:MAG TPA: carboxypeptidase-like regulatory domain-containing protein [Mucilaginibacter sp.]|nr:carboxypeptidase-like regulatory domain-containing protein [Mucilaginibacter sp.]